MTEADLSYIHEELRAFAVPLDTVVRDPDNARDHAARSVDTIAASLAEFGQRVPIIVNRATRMIEAGNGRYHAAAQLGWTHIAAIFVDDDESRALAYSLVDNRSAEVGVEWNWQRLADQLRTLRDDMGQDLALLGWHEHEAEPLLAAEFNPSKAVADLGGGDEGGASRHVPPIVVTYEQRQIVERAVERLREREGDGGLHEGRCVELICADYLAGAWR